MTPLDGLVVLYADDDPDDRFLMGEAWKEVGCSQRMSVLKDGDQVIRYLEAAAAGANGEPRPGLAIMDIKMPRKTGIETLAWIRASSDWGTLPVLLLTASSDRGDIERAYKSGANAFLVKPSSVNELIELVGAIQGFWFRFAELPAHLK
ncbi:MAG: response regulator [Proteobacteria bacterium]|nr:response regulator [Pseudomonadota bacterium]